MARSAVAFEPGQFGDFGVLPLVLGVLLIALPLGARNPWNSQTSDAHCKNARTPCGGEVLQPNARCDTMSHLTADAVVSYMSRAKRLM